LKRCGYQRSIGYFGPNFGDFKIAETIFMYFQAMTALTLPILALGGSGVVSVAAHLVAPDIQNMINLCAEGKIQEAQGIHYKFFELFKVLFITTNPVPVKTALEMAGIECRRLQATPMSA
jgi:4-hydroxy-tetrahydrodipicolinate synthase